MRLVIPVVLIAAAYVLLWLRVEPVPTWFFVFAWYPTLALLDAVATKLDGRLSLLGRPRVALSLLAWSPVIWLVFEAANFRLNNWYYVFLPRALAERWTGILVSFATVVPAVVLAERALDAAGVGWGWRPRPITLGFGDVRWSAVWGTAVTAAVLIWPRHLYPLIWGTLLLMCDPIVYRRRRELSLLGDIERGDWSRIARLMLGGLGIGLLWETYNHWARGKWIYTVPLLEDLKWFEMPPLGFVGFPFFALEAWAMYQALAVMGVAVSLTGDDGRGQAMRGDAVVARHRLSSPVIASLLAVLFTAAVLTGMARWTISSNAPERSVWERAETDESARLATLRGIGTEHAFTLQAASVSSVCDLAVAEPTGLWTRLHATGDVLGKRPTEAEVRVWIRAARRACPTAVP